LTAKPETQAVLLQITQSTLAQLIAQESTLALISDLLARAAIQVGDRHNLSIKKIRLLCDRFVLALNLSHSLLYLLIGHAGFR
jgi:hypothetical protein